MALVISVNITTTSGGLARTGELTIGRLEPLKGQEHSHKYRARLTEIVNGTETHQEALVDHVHEDGMWILISRALTALGHPGDN